MKPLNQKKRLIAILQFVGIYLSGLVLVGFAISSYTGVSSQERDLLQNQVATLTREVQARDSILGVERKRWMVLIRKAHTADSMSKTLVQLDKDLSAAQALGSAAFQSVYGLERDIVSQELGIRSEFRNWDGIPDTSKQARLGKYIEDAYQGMLAANKSLRIFKSDILKQDDNNAILIEKANLQTQLDQALQQKATGNELGVCQAELKNSKGAIAKFAIDADAKAKRVETLVGELKTIQQNINSFLGKNKADKDNLDRKIQDLNRVAEDLTALGKQMETAAK